MSVQKGWPKSKQSHLEKKYLAQEVTLFASHLVLLRYVGNFADIRFGAANITLGLATGAGLANMRKLSRAFIQKNDQGVDIMADQFDYIIVGAGSAGCVLANRLTVCGRYRVCVL